MIRKIVFTIALLFALSAATLLNAQQVTIQGKVTDQSSREAIEFVTVYIEGTSINTETDLEGRYSLDVDRQRSVVLIFSRLGYDEARMNIRANRHRYNQDITLRSNVEEVEVTISDSKLEEREMVRESAEVLKLLPSTTGNLESVLPHIALGARSGTGGELTSQYNVRGGNYDENLVYVNDFEVFRPQLLRTSQQEGLSFPNTDLIRDLSFSSGGFQAKYGDKTSSVLDIRYKRPTEFQGSASASLLGATAHIEGSALGTDQNPHRLRYLVGYRYKTNRYLLNTLDTEGEYNPNFNDVQAHLTFDINRDFQLGAIGNYNTSAYDFTPTSRSTALGLTSFAIQLNSVLSGAESDRFKTGLAGVSLTYIPSRSKNPLFLKFLASTYRGQE